jgi:putative oxidoreductase
MNIAVTIARVILGLLFAFAGASAFFMTPPPEPGIAGTFLSTLYTTHMMLFVSAAQFLLGVLLLVNRFVPVALIMLAAFLYNSFAFHITMAQAMLPVPVVVLALWFLIAWSYRALFAPLFVAKPSV